VAGTCRNECSDARRAAVGRQLASLTIKHQTAAAVAATA